MIFENRTTLYLKTFIAYFQIYYMVVQIQRFYITCISNCAIGFVDHSYTISYGWKFRTLSTVIKPIMRQTDTLKHLVCKSNRKLHASTETMCNASKAFEMVTSVDIIIWIRILPFLENWM
jgi:hypothetical protein